MPELSIENIERITQDVKRQKIVFSHLADDLIDHICCDVEHEMQDGLTFYEAYRKVKQKIGSRRLKEIQEETLYAVDTKYRYMKNTMKISGVAGAVLFGIATLFKIQHWAGAGIMMTLGAIILAFIFMPSALGVLWKETRSSHRLILFISSFLTTLFFILGTLFKVQHWPGAGTLLIIAMVSGIFFFIPALLVNSFTDQENRSKRLVYVLGAVGLTFFLAGILSKLQQWPLSGFLMGSSIIILAIVLPWYTWLTWKEESYITSRFLFIIIGSVALAVPGAMINLNFQYSYEDGFYQHQFQQQAMYNYLSENNNSLLKTYEDSSCYQVMNKIHSRTGGMLNLISSIQVRMIQESEGEPGKPALSEDQIKQTENGPEICYRLLSNPFHPGPVKDFLSPGSATMHELSSALTDYRQFLTSYIEKENLQKYYTLLEPSTYLPKVDPENTTISMMSGLHSLEILKNGLLTFESQILRTIPGNLQ